ncbi:MAG: alpha/beta hydrolase [Acidobacteria bacterium]|nr:alpha/beta hydrolase [Acidobacteriota bacterium]
MLNFAGIVLVAVAAGGAFGLRLALGKMMSTGGPPPGAIHKTARSRDGALIAYEQTGAGPVVILVSAALADRDGARPLARRLASSFTVINYDRRGRGESSDAAPYAVEREVEDLEALCGAAGEPVFLFGSSSGAVLALDAGSRLGARVRKLFLYEPPFIVDASHAPTPDSLAHEIGAAAAANDRDRAVALFFQKGMGIPAVGVTFMRLFLPAWRDMARIAHTAPYDLKILAGTQSGRPLPIDRWSRTTPAAMAAVGAKSEEFFHNGAKALAHTLPTAEYRPLDGLDHSAVLMAPDALAGAMRRYFTPDR